MDIKLSTIFTYTGHLHSQPNLRDKNSPLKVSSLKPFYTASSVPPAFCSLLSLSLSPHTFQEKNKTQRDRYQYQYLSIQTHLPDYRKACAYRWRMRSIRSSAPPPLLLPPPPPAPHSRRFSAFLAAEPSSCFITSRPSPPIPPWLIAPRVSPSSPPHPPLHRRRYLLLHLLK